jgi:hypothetical protein
VTRRVFLFFLFLALQGGSAIADQQPSETEWWHVRDALFTALPDSTYDEERVTRWVEQPVVVVLGATDEDQRYVKETVNEFNRLLGPVAIRIEAEDDIDANIGILIAPNRLFPQLASRHGMQVNIAMRGAGYTELTVRPDHAVRSSVTLVSDELEDTDRDATLIHELYHAMGPSGHSRRFEDSVIFQNADATSTATELAPIDIKLLALLYGYLSPGDTEADVRAAFDRHWIELDEFVTPTATCNCRRERHGPRKVE